MTAVMLREFMPYGAPDLQEAERTHLVRALALGSLLASLLFVLAWSLSVTLFRPAAAPRQVVISPIILDPDFSIVQPPPPLLSIPIAKPRPAKAEVGVPQPVEDTPLLLDQPIAPSGATQGPATGAVETIGAPPIAPVPDGPINGPGEISFPDQLPAPIRAIKPEYPDIAIKAQVEGLVLVDVLLGKDGRVLEARLDPKVNVPILNESALDAARKWVFTPALVNNRPVLVWIKLPFRYTLHN